MNSRLSRAKKLLYDVVIFLFEIADYIITFILVWCAILIFLSIRKDLKAKRVHSKREITMPYKFNVRSIGGKNSKLKIGEEIRNLKNYFPSKKNKKDKKTAYDYFNNYANKIGLENDSPDTLFYETLVKFCQSDECKRIEYKNNFFYSLPGVCLEDHTKEDRKDLELVLKLSYNLNEITGLLRKCYEMVDMVTFRIGLSSILKNTGKREHADLLFGELVNFNRGVRPDLFTIALDSQIEQSNVELEYVIVYFTTFGINRNEIIESIFGHNNEALIITRYDDLSQFAELTFAISDCFSADRRNLDATILYLLQFTYLKSLNNGENPFVCQCNLPFFSVTSDSLISSLMRYYLNIIYDKTVTCSENSVDFNTLQEQLIIFDHFDTEFFNCIDKSNIILEALRKITDCNNSSLIIPIVLLYNNRFDNSLFDSISIISTTTRLLGECFYGVVDPDSND